MCRLVGTGASIIKKNSVSLDYSRNFFYDTGACACRVPYNNAIQQDCVCVLQTYIVRRSTSTSYPVA